MHNGLLNVERGDEELELHQRDVPRDDASEQLRRLLRIGAIRLVRGEWLLGQRNSQSPLKRRQDLPEEAFATLSEAVAAVETNIVDVFSHGWLARAHPDPGNFRMKLFDRFDSVGYNYHRHGFADAFKLRPFIFWDWISLCQVDAYGHREPWEQELFSKALEKMHLVYSNSHWRVVRLCDVPPRSENSRPIEDRGWTTFEFFVASIGAEQVVSLRIPDMFTRCLRYQIRVVSIFLTVLVVMCSAVLLTLTISIVFVLAILLAVCLVGGGSNDQLFVVLQMVPWTLALAVGVSITLAIRLQIAAWLRWKLELCWERRYTSPLPVVPSDFEVIVRAKHFTSRNHDVANVIRLYRAIWPLISAKRQMTLVGCDRKKILRFLEIVPQMVNLEQLDLFDCSGFNRAWLKRQLTQAAPDRQWVVSMSYTRVPTWNRRWRVCCWLFAVWAVVVVVAFFVFISRV